jgi:hypothetical protein
METFWDLMDSMFAPLSNTILIKFNIFEVVLNKVDNCIITTTSSSFMLLIKSIKDLWLDTMNNREYIYLIINGLVQTEKELISHRTRKGMKIAKYKGKNIGRPKKPQTKIQHAIELYKSGNHSGNEIAEICGIARSTLYRKLKEEGLI